MLDHAAPYRFGRLGADAERAARGVLFVESIAGAAEQMIDHSDAAEALLHAHHRRDGFRRKIGGVDRHGWFGADVANTARFGAVFTEIAPHPGAAAGEAV